MRLAIAVALLATLVFVPSAEAYKTFNSWRWPGKTITYYDGTGKQYKNEVAAAAQAWNSSGVKVKWKKVSSKSKAQVPIRVNKKIPTAGIAWHLRRGRGLIEIQPGTKKLRQSKREGEWVATAIFVHEMGHIMGLDHETKKCAIMQPSLASGCVQPKIPWQFRCRLLEPDDVRGGTKLFGGKIGKVGPEFCDSNDPPPAPTGITAVYFDEESEWADVPNATGVRITWTTPKGGDPQSVRVLRRQDACPAGADDKQAQVVFEDQATPGKAQSGVDESGFPGAGSFCYAVVAMGAFNRPGAPGTVMYQHTGPASPAYRPTASFDYEADYDDPTRVAFVDDSSAGTDAQITSWRWDFADGTFSDEPNPTHKFTPRDGGYTVSLTVTNNKGQTDTTTRTVYVDEPIDHGDVEER